MDLKINGSALVGFDESETDKEYLRSLGHSDTEINAAFQEAKLCQKPSLLQASA